MKLWIKILLAALTMWATGSILKMTNLGNWVFFNKGIVSLGVFILALAVLPKAFRHWSEDKKAFLIGYFIGFALMFTELLGAGMRLELAAPDQPWIHGKELLLMTGTSFLLAFLTEPLFFKAAGFSLKPAKKPLLPFSLNQAFLIVWISLFLGYLPCLLAFYPGLCCYDISWQLIQARSWDFSTHHPLLHTLFSGGLLELGRSLTGSYSSGILLHSLVQLCMFTGGMAFAIRFLIKRNTNPAAITLTQVYFLLFPYLPPLGISTTKDVLFSVFFLITFVCICDMADQKSFYQGRRLAFFLAAAVLMCLFRNNAVHGLAVMAGCFILILIFASFSSHQNKFLQKKRVLQKIVCLIVFVIFISQGLFMALEKGLHAAKGDPAEMLSVPMQQMARSYLLHREEFSPEDKELLLDMFYEENLLNYKHYISDPVKSGFHLNNRGKKDFIRLWAKLGTQFPEEYVKAFLYHTMGLWYMGGDVSAYMEYDISATMKEAYGLQLESKLPWLRDYHRWFYSENLQLHLPGLSLLFFTSFYSWLPLLAAGIMAAKRQKRLLLLPLFLACYLFTLVFGPCTIIRYILGNILCTPILAVMVFQPSPASLPSPVCPATQAEETSVFTV